MALVAFEELIEDTHADAHCVWNETLAGQAKGHPMGFKEAGVSPVQRFPRPAPKLAGNEVHGAKA